MNEPAININSDETTYINDSGNTTSEHNITIDSENDLTISNNKLVSCSNSMSKTPPKTEVSIYNLGFFI
jgi:hypothetical protein